METIENRVLELIRTVCRLYYPDRSASDVPIALENEGFRNVSVNFVQAIFDMLSHEANKYMNACFENAEKSNYCTFETDDKYIIRRTVSLSERYFLSHACNGNLSGDFHEITVLDTFHNKSM
jgi:hypothetical protein